jgi:hypothetical protein
MSKLVGLFAQESPFHDPPEIKVCQHFAAPIVGGLAVENPFGNRRLIVRISGFPAWWIPSLGRTREISSD